DHDAEARVDLPPLGQGDDAAATVAREGALVRRAEDLDGGVAAVAEGRLPVEQDGHGGVLAALLDEALLLAPRVAADATEPRVAEARDEPGALHGGVGGAHAEAAAAVDVQAHGA